MWKKHLLLQCVSRHWLVGGIFCVPSLLSVVSLVMTAVPMFVVLTMFVVRVDRMQIGVQS